MKEIKLIYGFLAKYQRGILFYFASSLLVMLFDIPIPYISKLIVDNALLQKNIKLLLFLIGSIFFLKVVGNTLFHIIQYTSQKLSVNIGIYSNNQLFRHILKLNPIQLKRYPSGDIVSRFGNGQDAAIKLIDLVHTAIINILHLLIFGSLLSMINLKLFFLSILFLPIETLIVFKSSSIIKKYTKILEEKYAITQNTLQVTVHNIREVKSLKADEYSINKYKRNITESGELSLTFDKKMHYIGSCQSCIQGLGIALYGFCGWSSVINNELTLGSFVAFTSYLAYIYGPLKSLIAMMEDYQLIRVSALRYFEIFEIKPQNEEKIPQAEVNISGTLKNEKITMLSLKNVTFGYNPNYPIISNLTVDIPLYGLTVISGTSGVGKTTLMNLIAGFLMPQTGAITFHSTAKIVTREIQKRHIGCMAQKSFLFPSSIIENILMSETYNRNSLENVTRVLQKTNCDFVNNLPEKVFTEVGNNGNSLSLGQIQRLSLARLFYQKNKLLILDEPTNNLDRNNILKICNFFKDYSKKIPMILVTHDLNILSIADRVVKINSCEDIKVI